MFTIDHMKPYLAMGWKLFPCYAEHKSDPKKVKAPITEHGFHDATDDIKRLTEWFKEHPGCAWGTPTSAGAGVFEYDRRHDPDGKLWREHVEGKPMPDTWKSVSGGGSPHFWFRWPKGTRSSEIYGNAFGRKADGGYVLIPPSKVSIHPVAYRWEARPWEKAIAEAPDWLIGLFDKSEVKKKNSESDPWVVQEGKPDLLTHPGCDRAKGEQRRPKLCELIGVHLARGDNSQTIEAMVRGWASRCSPPLEEHEWRKHLDGLLSKEADKEANKGCRMTPTEQTRVSITEITGNTLEAVKEGSKSDAPNLLPSPFLRRKEGKKVFRMMTQTYLLPSPFLRRKKKV